MLSAVFALSMIALYDAHNIILYVLTALSLISGVTVLLGKRIGVYATAFTLPVVIVVSVATLHYSINIVGVDPNSQTLAFNILLALYVILWFLAGLLVIDKRDLLK